MKIKKVLAIIFALLTDVVVIVNPFISRMFVNYTSMNLNPFPEAIYACSLMIIFCGLLCVCTYLFTQIGKDKAVILTSAISAIVCLIYLVTLYFFFFDIFTALMMSLTSSVFFEVFTFILLFSRKKAEN